MDNVVFPFIFDKYYLIIDILDLKDSFYFYLYLILQTCAATLALSFVCGNYCPTIDN
jgi:hypothetical protein